MSLHTIETVVRERLGLDPGALGPTTLERAVDTRMRARGITDLALYASMLMVESVERDAFADELVVPETWFFRGGRPLFDRLAAFLADRVAPGRKVRALSIPCSTGEEPYSLAIALHERMLGPSEVSIDAVDVSAPVLERAKAACYSAFAFREAGIDLRPTYFRPVGDRWELLPSLRSAVRFLRANLADPRFLANESAYDLILCRNLFIYLTPDARQRAVTNLDRLLAADGRLCVTPAEADRLPSARFTSDGPTEFGIYRRVTAVPLARNTNAVSPAVVTTVSVVPVSSVVPTSAESLATARALADAGNLDEARARCEALIQARPTDADALTLLGVIHVAAGRHAEAFEALRKALYLAPEHTEAMAHMVVLCERRGEAARAAALRRQLDRLTGPNGGSA